jgi:hypothetical protein
VWRIALVGSLLAIGLWFAIDALITTDLERVEAEVERLLEVARKGGPEAADEILAAFAEDYRGSGFYARENVERHARRFLAAGRPEEISIGWPKAVPKGEEIQVPILRVDVRTKRDQGTTFVRLTFARRDGRFKIVNAEQALGR